MKKLFLELPFWVGFLVGSVYATVVILVITAILNN
jgi:hypothetical protein